NSGHLVRVTFAAAIPPFWLYSPRFRRASSRVQRPTKLFDKVARRRQIGKAPAIIKFTFPYNSLPMARFNVSRGVKIHNAAVQCDIQLVGADDKFLFPLMGQRITILATS